MEFCCSARGGSRSKRLMGKEEKEKGIGRHKKDEEFEMEDRWIEQVAERLESD